MRTPGAAAFLPQDACLSAQAHSSRGTVPQPRHFQSLMARPALSLAHPQLLPGNTRGTGPSLCAVQWSSHVSLPHFICCPLVWAASFLLAGLSIHSAQPQACSQRCSMGTLDNGELPRMGLLFGSQIRGGGE